MKQPHKLIFFVQQIYVNEENRTFCHLLLPFIEHLLPLRSGLRLCIYFCFSTLLKNPFYNWSLSWLRNLTPITQIISRRGKWEPLFVQLQNPCSLLRHTAFQISPCDVMFSVLQTSYKSSITGFFPQYMKFQYR